MDLLSLTFRTLDLDAAISKQDLTESMEKLDRVEPKDTSRRKQKQLEESRTSGNTKGKDLPVISLSEVAWHDTADNCWLAIEDFVYDCTEFLDSHPGGADVLLEYAGRDATLAFIGTGHSHAARKSLERYLIGELPPVERIFRVPGGVKIADF